MLRRLKKYELVDEIGHGGMATVYRARDTRLDREVAVKVMHPHLKGAPEARARFVREARSVARLRHPNILEIYDSSEKDSEESFIVTELLTGPTLKSFVEKHGPAPAEVAACLGLEIAGALANAHEAGIIHRDVKPENVLLHEARTIKLTDFGIAQIMDAQSFTATGQILGSPGHMAPEQVEGQECDSRTDVFSLGTVLYYVATGRLPFPGRNPHHVLRKIMESDFVDPVRARPAVGEHLGAIIRRAMARQPSDRYPGAREMEQDLTDFVRTIQLKDPTRTLARYLASPEPVTAEIHRRVVEHLVPAGEQSARAGRIHEALQYYNRVLAIDEGNTRVLTLIERLGTRSRRRTWVATLGVALGVVGVGAIGWASFGGFGALRASTGTPSTGAPPRALPSRNSGRPAPLGSDARVAAAGASRASRPAVPDGGSVPEPRDRPRTRSGAPPAPRVPSPAGAGGKRTVRFLPTPRSVQVSVDDGPFREFFQPIELEPGRHRFVFRGDCCRELAFIETVPAGPGETRIARTLELRPAQVYVRSNVAGNVTLGDGLASGRTREILTLPLRTTTRSVAIVVTAPGYREYRSTQMLRPGQLTNLAVTLEEASGSAR